jgi:hypothetical protein
MGYLIKATSSSDTLPTPANWRLRVRVPSPLSRRRTPIQLGETGIRFFVTDEKGEVRQAISATFADATPLE